MHIELLYLGIAYVVSMLILYRFGYPLIKQMLVNKAVLIKRELNSLEQNLAHCIEVKAGLESAKINMQEKVRLLENSIPRMLKEQRNIIFEKNLHILDSYKKWCEQKFILEVQHNQLLEMKMTVVNKIIDSLMIELKKDEDCISDSVGSILNTYKTYDKDTKNAR